MVPCEPSSCWRRAACLGACKCSGEARRTKGLTCIRLLLRLWHLLASLLLGLPQESDSGQRAAFDANAGSRGAGVLVEPATECLQTAFLPGSSPCGITLQEWQLVASGSFWSGQAPQPRISHQARGTKSAPNPDPKRWDKGGDAASLLHSRMDDERAHCVAKMPVATSALLAGARLPPS